MKKQKKIKKPYKKCVELAKEIAKIKDGYRCLKCGATDKQIHGSHIFGVGAYPRLGSYPENIKALCSTHHRWWHSAPTESSNWFKKTYPERYKTALDLKNENTLKKIDYQKRYYELKQIRDNLLITQ